MKTSLVARLHHEFVSCQAFQANGNHNLELIGRRRFRSSPTDPIRHSFLAKIDQFPSTTAQTFGQGQSRRRPFRIAVVIAGKSYHDNGWDRCTPMDFKSCFRSLIDSYRPCQQPMIMERMRRFSTDGKSRWR